MITQIKLLALSVICCHSLLAIQETVAFENRGKRDAPKVELIGTLQISGERKDRSNLTATLTPTNQQTVEPNSTYTHNQFGGISAVAAVGDGKEFYFLADRGPLDGAVDWHCRVHRCRLGINLENDRSLAFEILETILLKDGNGNPLTGLASAYSATNKQGARFDPEGIRVLANGNLLMSDEYGPRIIEFTPDGSFVREFETPQHLCIANPGLDKPDENGKNAMGRSCNRGMEGLALSEDRQTVYGLMQSPLLQDCERSDLSESPGGLNVRLFEFSIGGQLQQEMVYRLDSEDYKLNEILSCGEEQFIVIERDGAIGEAAGFKKLMLVSTTNASNVMGQKSLPRTAIPASAQPIKKSVLIDLLDPRWGLRGKQMPEKLESLAFGPVLEDGRNTLIVVSDNDFEPHLPTMIYVFAVPSFNSVAVPQSHSISQTNR